MALDAWVERIAAALGQPDEPVDVRVLLDLARDAAHGVERPAAPLTTYLVGVAVGRGMPLEQAMAQVRAELPAGAGGPAATGSKATGSAGTGSAATGSAGTPRANPEP